MRVIVISNCLKTFMFTSLFLSGVTISIFAQSIGKPSFQYTGMCARPEIINIPPPNTPAFDLFLVDFGIGSINLFAPGNIFYLQISNASGSFASATDVAQSATITSSPASLTFQVPNNFVGGEGYKFRVRSTDPVRLSPESDAIYAYYKPFSDNFRLNNGAVTAVICGTGTVELKVNSPASTFSNLIYRWYKDGLIIPNQTSNTYVADAAGAYYAEINYGSCTTSGFTFNSKPDIIVNISTIGSNPIITKSRSSDKVSADNPITLSTNTGIGFTYQWFLDNVLIVGATNDSFTATVPGDYKVVITTASCSYTSDTKKLLLSNSIETPTSTQIPNLVSPNNDGENDKWEISKFTGNAKTAVLILDSRGKKVFESSSYQDTWPEEPIDFDKINPVFYYVITTSTGEQKKGTITIVK